MCPHSREPCVVKFQLGLERVHGHSTPSVTRAVDQSASHVNSWNLWSSPGLVGAGVQNQPALDPPLLGSTRARLSESPRNCIVANTTRVRILLQVWAVSVQASDCDESSRAGCCWPGCSEDGQFVQPPLGWPRTKPTFSPNVRRLCCGCHKPCVQAHITRCRSLYTDTHPFVAPSSVEHFRRVFSCSPSAPDELQRRQLLRASERGGAVPNLKDLVRSRAVAGFSAKGFHAALRNTVRGFRTRACLDTAAGCFGRALVPGIVRELHSAYSCTLPWTVLRDMLQSTHGFGCTSRDPSGCRRCAALGGSKQVMEPRCAGAAVRSLG